MHLCSEYPGYARGLHWCIILGYDTVLLERCLGVQFLLFGDCCVLQSRDI